MSLLEKPNILSLVNGAQEIGFGESAEQFRMSLASQ